MQSSKPSLFIGSSSEGLPHAKALQLLLDPTCEVVIWTQGVFGLSEQTLESLATQLRQADFAVLLLTADDLVQSREKSYAAPRDNVLFELGLFVGGLGRDRTFFVYDRTSEIKIPSDLAGITAGTFAPHSSGNLESALGATATRIENSVRRLGFRSPHDLAYEQRQTSNDEDLKQADFFSQWDDSHFRQELGKAQTIALLAIANYVFLSRNADLIEEFLKRGGSLRCILVAPALRGIQMAAALASGFEQDPQNLESQIDLAIKQLLDLSSSAKTKEQLQVKLVDHLPYAIVTMLDEHADNGRMFVTLNGFAQHPSSRPSFVLEQTRDPRWFRFYLQSFESLWEWKETQAIDLTTFGNGASEA